jgi:hypothetical protein
MGYDANDLMKGPLRRAFGIIVAISTTLDAFLRSAYSWRGCKKQKSSITILFFVFAVRTRQKNARQATSNQPKRQFCM